MQGRLLATRGIFGGIPKQTKPAISVYLKLFKNVNFGQIMGRWEGNLQNVNIYDVDKNHGNLRGLFHARLPECCRSIDTKTGWQRPVIYAENCVILG